MKTVIEHNYNTSRSWLELFAQTMGGSVNGNFVKGDNEIYEGTQCVLPVEDGITAILSDKTYKQDILVKYRNENSNFMGLYFYLTDQDIDFVLNGNTTVVGELNYNLSIVDSDVDMDYGFQKGTRIFAICILFDKDILSKKLHQIDKKLSLNNIFLNAEKNAVIRLDRIDPESLFLISDFRKIAYDNALYEIFFKGLVYQLTSNYLQHVTAHKDISDRKKSTDLKNILKSKKLLKNIVEEPFPGINYLAEQVCMSPSKFKKLFTEISGLNPGTYFYKIKLNRAKEMLETGKYNVNEVARQLNYSTVSYLGKRFNERYGICPKKYQSLF